MSWLLVLTDAMSSACVQQRDLFDDTRGGAPEADPMLNRSMLCFVAKTGKSLAQCRLRMQGQCPVQQQDQVSSPVLQCM